MAENPQNQALNIRKDLRMLLILVIVIGVCFGGIKLLDQKTDLISKVVSSLHLATLGNTSN